MKFPSRDSAGRLLVGGVAVDVTERVCAEAGMREVSDRYQALFDSTFDAVIMHESGVVLGMNHAACELFGYSQEEVMGRYAIDMVVPPETRESVLGHIKADTASCYETVMRRKDGTTFPAEVRGRTIDYKGRPVRVASIRDLTARKAEEAAPAGGRGAAAPVAEDGGGRPAGRRRGPRLQQPAHRHHRLQRAPARRAWPASRAAQRAARDLKAGRARRRPDPPAPGLQPAGRSCARACSTSTTCVPSSRRCCGG